MSDSVVFLAFDNPDIPVEEKRLACASCRNKTWVVRYDEGEDFPGLQCACCGSWGGRIGWIENE